MMGTMILILFALLFFAAGVGLAFAAGAGLEAAFARWRGKPKSKCQQTPARDGTPPYSFHLTAGSCGPVTQCDDGQFRMPFDGKGFMMMPCLPEIRQDQGSLTRILKPGQ